MRPPSTSRRLIIVSPAAGPTLCSPRGVARASAGAAAPPCNGRRRPEERVRGDGVPGRGHGLLRVRSGRPGVAVEPGRPGDPRAGPPPHLRLPRPGDRGRRLRLPGPGPHSPGRLLLAGRPRPDGAAGVCLAWAGTSAQQVFPVRGRSPFQRLVLLGSEHDWAFILARLGLLDRAEGFATTVRGLGLLLAGIGACLWGLAQAQRERPVPEVGTGPAWG